MSTFRTDDTWVPQAVGRLMIVLALGVICAATASAQVPEYSETFTNDSGSRAVGAPLDGVAPEVGSGVWSAAASGFGFGTGVLTNLNTQKVNVATLPFELGEHPEYAGVSISAQVLTTGSDYALAFTPCPDAACIGNSASLRIQVRSSGVIRVLAYSNVLYTSDPNGTGDPDPLFVHGILGMKLGYNRVENTVKAWINGTPLSLQITDLDDIGVVPEIHHAMIISASADPAYASPGTVLVDDFAVTTTDRIAPLAAEVSQDNRIVNPAMPAALDCVASGGVGPYSYNWQYYVAKDEQFVDLVDDSNMDGAATATLRILEFDPFYAGRYRCRVVDSNIVPSAVASDETELTVGAVLLGDYFTNTDASRVEGSPLNAVEPEINQTGNQALVWQANSVTGFGADLLTNIGVSEDSRSFLPYAPGSHSGHGVSRVEAMVNPSGSSWVAIGLANAAQAFWNSGQLWMYVKTTGDVRVFADGTTRVLASEQVAQTTNPSGCYHLTLEYDRINNSVRAWVDEHELAVDTSAVDGFIPTIQYAGVMGHVQGGYFATDVLVVDAFLVSLRAPLDEIEITPQPRTRILPAGADASFECGASGGVPPYSYQWEVSADGVDFQSLPADPRITGSTGSTLTISSIGSQDAMFYRCTVSDSNSPATTVVSESAQLLLVEPLADACGLLDPPPADFTTWEGFSEWVSDGLSAWSFDADSARFDTGNPRLDGYLGEIRRSTIPVPVGYDTLRIEFSSLTDPLRIKLRWGPGEADVVTAIAAATDGTTPTIVAFQLDGNASWLSSEVYDGFCLRDLTLELWSVNGLATDGNITRIDAEGGPVVRLADIPELKTWDGQDPATYGAGASMRLFQFVQNHGCDMVSAQDQDEWKIGYSLCRPGQPDTDCITAGFDCLGTGDPAHAVITELLPAGDSYEYQACILTLPEAGVQQQNLGDWEVRASFVNHPEVPGVVQGFTLDATGDPDLQVPSTRTVTADYWDDQSQHWSSLDQIRTSQPFSVSVGIMSVQYPSLNVPVTIYARVHEPWTGPPTNDAPPWQEVGQGVLPLVPTGIGAPAAVGARIDGVVLPESLLPDGKSWGLVDLLVWVDPPATSCTDDPGAIVELAECNNHLVLHSWITLSTVDIGDAIAGAENVMTIGPAGDPHLDFDSDAGQCDQTIALYGDGVDCHITSLSSLSLQLYYDIRHGYSRLIFWDRPEQMWQPTAMLVRYRRSWLGSGDGFRLIAGGQEFYQDPWIQYKGDPPLQVVDTNVDAIMTGYSPNLTDQWRVYLWRGDLAGEPLYEYAASIPQTDLAVFPFSNAGLKGWSVGVELQVDSSGDCGYYPDGWSCENYPTHEFGLIRVWGKDGGDSPVLSVDLRPLAVLELFDGQWTELRDALPLNNPVELAISIRNYGTEQTVLSDADIQVNLFAPDGSDPIPLTPFATGGQTTIPADGGAQIQLMIDGSTQWIPSIQGEYRFEVLVTSPDDEQPDNNSMQRTVTVGCPGRLVLPTNLKPVS